MLPPDINPESRCRLPRVKREDLDPDRQARFDKAVDPKGGTIRGLAGPAGIHLHSKKLSTVGEPLGRYLRFEAGFSPRVRETAILISARMSDSRRRVSMLSSRSAVSRACFATRNGVSP